MNPARKPIKRIKCECGHWKTSHYSYFLGNRLGCHAVSRSGEPSGCKCLKSQEDLARATKVTP